MGGTDDFASAVRMTLPYLRRYARALTGSQAAGDDYAAATLEAVLQDRSQVDQASTTRIGLFSVFHAIWNNSGAPIENVETGLQGRAQAHLAPLTANSREALLLHTIENFTVEEVGEIMSLNWPEANDLIEVARTEMQGAIAGALLIIEDEPIIAMDLQTVATDMGHRVTAIARTRADAVEQVSTDLPNLILADIQLADQSSGIDAVKDILAEIGPRPVIFITAFPERFLTGEKPEPAFMIAKPYTEAQVRSAISQAMFFSSTETLRPL